LCYLQWFNTDGFVAGRTSWLLKNKPVSLIPRGFFLKAGGEGDTRGKWLTQACGKITVKGK